MAKKMSTGGKIAKGKSGTGNAYDKSNKTAKENYLETKKKASKVYGVTGKKNITPSTNDGASYSKTTTSKMKCGGKMKKK